MLTDALVVTIMLASLGLMGVGAILEHLSTGDKQ